MIIREIKIDDYVEIAFLNQQLGYDYEVELVRQRIKKILSCTNDKILVAVDMEQYSVIGYIHASPYELLYCDSLINILGLVVDKEKRNIGIGKELIQSIEIWAKQNNYLGIRLVSGSDRVNAHKFYEHCGFTNRKEQKNFIKIF